MARWFEAAGCDALHTLDLPARNRTPDQDVAGEADRTGCVVISKDADFVDSHLLHDSPKKLLLISTGNISNDQLQTLIVPLIPEIVREFQTCNFIELARTGLILRA
jgi:predicted nuclease of predicted toxin-antitoxin system